MKKNIVTHFQSVDPILHAVLEKIPALEDTEKKSSSEYFKNLCEQIISQQLAGKAADAIFKRFEDLFPNRIITVEHILTLNDQDIRDIGASWAKARYIKDLAQKIVNKELLLEKLDELENELVIKELTKVKGIGPWTAEMFLMFTLQREDIFSHGDLGLRNAIKKLYKFKKNPTRKQIEKIAAKWTPYKTYASRILWKSLEL